MEGGQTDRCNVDILTDCKWTSEQMERRFDECRKGNLIFMSTWEKSEDMEWGHNRRGNKEV
jgi:hypothetical protein